VGIVFLHLATLGEKTLVMVMLVVMMRMRMMMVVVVRWMKMLHS
jgi:hypothetical protein